MTEALKIDLIELVRRAYMMGFCASGEGYNGEYPFGEDLNEIDRELSQQFEKAFPEILAVVAVKEATDAKT